MKLVVNNYEHGGSRMYFEGEQPDHPLESPDRDLIVDTFQDKKFSDYIEKCVKEYYDIE